MDKAKKQLYNACYRARDYGYIVQVRNRIVFIDDSQFNLWMNFGIYDCIKMLQELNFRVILKT